MSPFYKGAVFNSDLDCWEHKSIVRMPLAFKNSKDLRDDFIDMISENYPGSGFWRKNV